MVFRYRCELLGFNWQDSYSDEAYGVEPGSTRTLQVWIESGRLLIMQVVLFTKCYEGRVLAVEVFDMLSLC